MNENLITDAMRVEILDKIKPWEKCNQCNDQGINKETKDVCDCVRKAYRLLILGIPERYNVRIELSKPLQKLVDNAKKYKFVTIIGEMKYIKLLAYHLAREIIDEGGVACYVMSQQRIDAEFDFLKINEADLLLFEDITQKLSDINYKVNLTRRIDKDKPILFLGKQSIIEEDDDFYEIDIDCSDLVILESI